jgi:2-hydroxy-3-keto-5-methylthiopentenyl-1-phosphate phosphatase
MIPPLGARHAGIPKATLRLRLSWGGRVGSIESLASLRGAIHGPRRTRFLDLCVYTDFDGTIAREDVTDTVLQRFAPPEWTALEAAWRAGEIDAAACMRRQIALIEAPRAALDGFLDGVELDPGFPRFVRWCEDEGVPLVVVSDGVDYFVRRILARHGFGRLPVFANQLVFAFEGYALLQPWLAPACRAGAGVCKCAIAADQARAGSKALSVYVGDGLSDRCVAASADLLFAKDELAAHCREHHLPFIPFESFADVRGALLSIVRPGERGDDERAV